MKKEKPREAKEEKSEEKFEAIFNSLVFTKVGGGLFGFILAILLSLTMQNTIYLLRVYLILLVLIVLASLIIRPLSGRTTGWSQWGITSSLLLGLGLGSLVYVYREWFKWLWFNLIRVNEPIELVLAGLFLFGVVLAVFVVRAWSKEQDDFNKSITAFLGGTAITPLVGDVVADEPLRAFAYYFLGFSMSIFINIVLCGWLIASYSNRRSLHSRALLDFMYGQDKAKAVDGLFEKNFIDNEDVARKLIVEALTTYKGKVTDEFANRMQLRREKETALWKRADNEKAKKPDEMPQTFNLNRNRRYYYELLSIMMLPQDTAATVGATGTGEAINAGNKTAETGAALSQATEGAEGGGEKKPVEPPTQTEGNASGNAESKRVGEFKVVFRRIKDEKAGKNPVEPEKTGEDNKQPIEECEKISGSMFRMGITLKWQNSLEYILAPGTYKQSFPYEKSVAGLALKLRKTIVMERDKDKEFRTDVFLRGITPGEVEQSRGLDEVSYLSYISIPIIANLGKPTEEELGVVNVDTMLFATKTELEKQAETKEIDGESYWIRKTTEEMTEMACNLYDMNDECVEFLNEMKAVVEPVLRLYWICRQGST